MGAARSELDGASCATALITVVALEMELIAGSTFWAKSEVGAATTAADTTAGTTGAATATTGGGVTPGGGARGTVKGMPVVWIVTCPAIVPAAGTATNV